ncbi:MAG: hypothetical protein VW405_00860 [Rhodospirillaceae bacterium]
MAGSSFSITIDATSLKRAMARLDRNSLEKRAHTAMRESVVMLQGKVQDNVPVNTGVSRGSVFGDVHGRSIADLRGIVASPLEHMTVLEYGRRPGQTMPPVRAIQLWARRKLGDGSRGTAFIIARAIGRKGTRAHHMFRDAADKGHGVISRIWARHLSGL